MHSHVVSRPSSKRAALARGSIGATWDALADDGSRDDDVAAVEEVGVGALAGRRRGRTVGAGVLEDQGLVADASAGSITGGSASSRRHQLGGVDGLRARLGEHDGEDLADEADLAGGDERAEHLLGDSGERGAEHPEVDVGGGQHLHAGQRGRLRRVDLQDPGVRQVRAHERRVQRPRQLKVVDVLPLAGDEPRVLAPADALADHGRVIPERIQATNTPWKGSRAHRETAPPGTAG